MTKGLVYWVIFKIKLKISCWLSFSAKNDFQSLFTRIMVKIKFSKQSVQKLFLYSLIANMKSRSSPQMCSMKKGVPRNFTKLTVKHLCQSLFFGKFAGLRSVTLLKKRLWHRCFPVNFAKFLRTPFLKDTFGQLVLFIYLFFFYSLFKADLNYKSLQ